MDSETKVVYHSSTIVDASISNPPPYSGYPPDQPGPPGPMQYGPPAAVVYTTATPTVVVAQQVGPQPSTMVCRSCHAEIVSRVEKHPSIKTHLFALLLFLCGCWCCICVPYCTDSCKNSNHYCPNCNAYIGSYKD